MLCPQGSRIDVDEMGKEDVMRSRTRARRPRASIGTALVLMATGGVLDAPATITTYVDLLDLGLILVWAGILILVMQVVMTRRPRRAVRYSSDDRDLDLRDVPGDATVEHDVHRPGYAGQTRRLPTIRGR